MTIGVDKKMPKHMNRREKIAMIRALKKEGREREALMFWLLYGAGISRNTYEGC